MCFIFEYPPENVHCKNLVTKYLVPVLGQSRPSWLMRRPTSQRVLRTVSTTTISSGCCFNSFRAPIGPQQSRDRETGLSFAGVMG